jgi:hypothetical protein
VLLSFSMCYYVRMHKKESAQKSAHNIPTSWQGERFAARWASSPEEVPEWDPARGGDGRVSFKRAGKETYAERLEFEHAHAFGSRAAIIEPPTDPGEYPRIVRVSPWSTPQSLEIEQAPIPDRLLDELAALIPQDRQTPLTQVVEGDLFREGVKGIVGRYGAFGAGNPGAAWEWVQAGAVAAAHLDLIYCIDGAQELDGHFSPEDIRDDALGNWGIRLEKQQEKQELAWPGEVGGAAHAAFQYVFSSLPVQNALARGKKADARAFRESMAEYLRDQFLSLAAKENALVFDPREGRINIRVGVGAWMYWELAAHYVNGTPVAHCEGCGKKFIPKGKQKFCTPNVSRCRMAAARKEQNRHNSATTGGR